MRKATGLYSAWIEVVPRPLRALFLPELRPFIVRYVYRTCELEAAKRSHSEGDQKDAMLQGIASYHNEMEAFNPRWLLDLLESLPNVAQDASTEDAGKMQCPGLHELA